MITTQCERLGLQDEFETWFRKQLDDNGVLEGIEDPTVVADVVRILREAGQGQAVERDPSARQRGRKGDAITSGAIHTRVATMNGRPGDWLCVVCGRNAAHWANIGTDPDEWLDKNGKRCAHVEFYVPTCIPHNRTVDSKGSRA